MRKREANQPRKSYRAKADVFPFTVGSNACPTAQGLAGFVGVQERGERTKVMHAYLGGLVYSAKER